MARRVDYWRGVLAYLTNFHHIVSIFDKITKLVKVTKLDKFTNFLVKMYGKVFCDGQTTKFYQIGLSQVKSYLPNSSRMTSHCDKLTKLVKVIKLVNVTKFVKVTNFLAQLYNKVFWDGQNTKFNQIGWSERLNYLDISISWSFS